MAFLLTNLIQNILSDLGQTAPDFGLFSATGGSATTFVNSAWGNLESPPETDAFKNYLAIVVRDAAGASASPEGKWGLCSGYADATWTGTIATVTDAIASGDTIMLAKQDLFPLQQIIFSINRALQELGDTGQIDTSLTTAANQTEYAIPVAAKRGLKKVYVQGYTGDANDNEWTEIFGWRVDPAAGGSTGVLYLPQLSSGYTLRLLYVGAHPIMSTYSDVISEYIHPKVITAAAILEVLKWYNHRDENQGANKEYYLWLEGEYENKKLPLALVENPIWRPRTSPKYSVFGSSGVIDTVPDPIT